MNKLLTILFLTASAIYCQESLMEEEITLHTSNVPGQSQIIFALDAIGTVWANSAITNNYKIAKDTTVGNVNSYGRGWRIQIIILIQ
ncbi:MAG: hypothetical protein IPM56_15605 [Ignavibacteriales bacterium]|nr:MAG: hypothetical protein IPM56_15605 [Ignavibacteriales bacterium]